MGERENEKLLGSPVQAPPHFHESSLQEACQVLAMINQEKSPCSSSRRRKVNILKYKTELSVPLSKICS